jgi:hypothetical protein
MVRMMAVAPSGQGDVRPPEAVGTIVVPIVGGLIAVVIVIGAAVVVMRGKSSVEKAERAQAAAAAGDNRYGGRTCTLARLHALAPATHTVAHSLTSSYYVATP